MLVSQSCLTLCDPMDYSPPGSSVHGISQGRILKWIAISFSMGPSQIRGQTFVFCMSLWSLLRPSYWTLLAVVGFLVVFANPRKEAKLPSHQTQSRHCLFQLYYSPYIISRGAQTKNWITDDHLQSGIFAPSQTTDQVLPLLLQNTLSSHWAVHSMGSKVQEVNAPACELDLTPMPALSTPHRDCWQ